MLLNWEGYSWLFLRAAGVSPNQLLQLLQPYSGRFPATQQEFEDMTLATRRMARIIERHPGNLASSLQTQPANMFAINEQNSDTHGHSFPVWGGYDQYPVQDAGFGQQQPAGLGAADMGGNVIPPWPADHHQGQGYGSSSGYDHHPDYNYVAVGEDSGTESDTSSDYLSLIHISEPTRLRRR